MLIISTFVALALSNSASISAALAGDLGPLLAGTSTGVKQAQAGDNTIFLSVLAVGVGCSYRSCSIQGWEDYPSSPDPALHSNHRLEQFRVMWL